MTKITKKDIAAVLESPVSKPVDRLFYDRKFLEDDPESDSYIVAMLNEKADSEIPRVDGSIKLSDCNRNVTWYFETPYFLYGQTFDKRLTELREVINRVEVNRVKMERLRSVIEEFSEVLFSELDRVEEWAVEELEKLEGKLKDDKVTQDDESAT